MPAEIRYAHVYQNYIKRKIQLPVYPSWKRIQILIFFFQSDLKQAEKNGMDDGRSQTRHLMPKLKILCQNAQGVSQTFLSSVVDHHSSSYGDKGWGCGYRNLQMLISSLAHHSIFSGTY